MSSKKQPCVLIVDDDGNNRDVLVRGLSKYGCVVTAVNSGVKALKIFDVQKYDVVLLDINLPEMDGFEVLKNIRSHKTVNGIKVIMMSAQNDTEIVGRCKDVGADDYLLKPLSLFDVVKRIENQLDGGVLLANQQAVEAAVSKAVILVVDDEELNREILQKRINKYGCTPVVSEGADEALQKLQEYNVDLILLDIMMPEIDGIQFLATLKSSEKFRQIPVVMLTALSEKESVEQCIKLGAVDYLLKPFDNTKLKERVEFHINRKS